MKQYRYETHCHTSQASACAVSTGKEMARMYHEIGYAGIIITDHFFNGNTCIAKDLPWKERVDAFLAGYQEAKAEGDRLGLSVFLGWEYNDKTMEILTYGLDEAWLYEKKDVLEWTLEEYCKRAHAAGAFLSQAHPFREAPYIKKRRLFDQWVDAFETVNTSHNNPVFDQRAKAYARPQGMLETSGSDSHNAAFCTGGGMAFDHPLQSIQEFIQAVKKRKYTLLGE